MRRIVRATMARPIAMLERMAKERDRKSSAEDLPRFECEHKGKKLSNEDWKSPADADARIARMKDGTDGSWLQAGA